MLATTRRPISFGFAVALVVLAVIGVGSVAQAHDGIASSDPASGSSIAAPISVATLDFGTVIGDDSELALISPGDDVLASTTVITSPTTAEIRFEPLAEQGTYIIRYLATSADDGHLLVGAVSFTYGSAPGRSVVPWLLFGVLAVIILAIGAVFSRRAHRRNAEPVDAAAVIPPP